MSPRSIPKVSRSTLATGARQFVVQEAFERMKCFAGSKVFSLTPRTNVASGFFAGAEMITRLAPALRCFSAPSRSVNLPVDSMTISTPSFPQGSSDGSFAASTWTVLPATTSALSFTPTSSSNRPWTESYFRRCASVLASVISFTATISIAGSLYAARKKFRPIRPNPLIPTFTAMSRSSCWDVSIQGT